jgi:plastocyanin
MVETRCDTFSLTLYPVSSIHENEEATLSGVVSNLDVLGGEVTLDIDWGDTLSLPQNQQFTLKDDGTGDDLVAGDGQIEFSFSKQYLDDNPSATACDNYTINVDAKEEFLVGTDVSLVIDVSGSTVYNLAVGVSVGDLDGDGVDNTILDAEIAAGISLINNLVNEGLGEEANVSIAVYGEAGALIDLDPTQAGIQQVVKAGADENGDSILDIEEALKTLFSSSTIGGGAGQKDKDGFNGVDVGENATNFEAGLQAAIQGVQAAGTAPDDGTVIFLSDGYKNAGGDYTDEAKKIREDPPPSGNLGQILRAFGVGSGSSLTDLLQIDSNAEKFTDVQKLLDLFAGYGAGTNEASESTPVQVCNLDPTTLSLSTDPDPAMILEGDEITITASFHDEGTLDTHHGTLQWGDGYSDSLNLNDSYTHTYNTPGSHTATLTFCDDDLGCCTETVDILVVNKVDLDWKPGSNPSSMNFKGGKIPVAILGAADFEVEDIDPASVRFDDEMDVLFGSGGVGINSKKNDTYQYSYEDSNSDGYMDLVAHIDAKKLGSAVNDDGDPFQSGEQIYAFGAYDGNYFLGCQHFGDPIKILG